MTGYLLNRLLNNSLLYRDNYSKGIVILYYEIKKAIISAISGIYTEKMNSFY